MQIVICHCRERTGEVQYDKWFGQELRPHNNKVPSKLRKCDRGDNNVMHHVTIYLITTATKKLAIEINKGDQNFTYNEIKIFE